MWHIAWFDRSIFAGHSCWCNQNKNHLVGEEKYPSPSEVHMSDIENKRQALMKLYGPSWAAKVKTMPNAQVVALYFKFKNEGKIR